MENANPLSWFLALALAFGLAGCRGDAPAAPDGLKTVADRFEIDVGGRSVRLQVAVLSAELERGLMGRRDLGADEGMIFIFDSPQRLGFWMHDTLIPLDVGYFTADGELAEVYPMFPFDERAVSSRSSRLQFALEMNQGWFARNEVRPGARLDLGALIAALRARGFSPKKLGLPQ